MREEPEHIYRAGDSQAFPLSPTEVPPGYPDPPPMECVVVRYGVICYSYDSSKEISQHMKKSVETLNLEFGSYVQIRHVTDPWKDAYFRAFFFEGFFAAGFRAAGFRADGFRDFSISRPRRR